MKILHCCLAAFYIDGYSYQENILPREHKKNGYEVRIIASTETFLGNNKLGYSKPRSYYTEDGIPITRLAYSKLLPHFIMKKLRLYKGVEDVLSDFEPEIIFIHDLQFLDIKYFVKYAKKYPKTKIYVDCHADFSNSARGWVSKNILHKIIYRYCANQIEPYTRIFWGVLPARVDFLKNMYKLPPKKVKLLVMGAEDDEVNEALDEVKKQSTRSEFCINSDDFLIVTGGKIDSAKKQTLMLMKAVRNINNVKLKLIVFGSVSEELVDEFTNLCDGQMINYIGWINVSESYKVFAAADIAIFPGRHSVFWEQVAGLGIPMIVKYWHGTTHIDLGGNVSFLHNNSVDEIEDKIRYIIGDSNAYQKMNQVAKEKGMEAFSYKKIAMKSIEL